MADTYTPLYTNTLGSATSTVTLSSISAAYTDLELRISGPTAANNVDIDIVINGDTATNYSRTVLYGSGTSAGSVRGSGAGNEKLRLTYQGNGSTTSWLGEITFNNYKNTTTYKMVTSKALNSDTYGVSLQSGLWRSTSAINQIAITASGSTFTAGTTFNLYGITAGPATATGTAKATGGTITTDSFGYVYHAFTSGSASFTPSSAITGAEALVVAGGGSGGWPYAGGGGGGGVLYTNNLSFNNGVAYTCAVGAGAAGSYSTLGAKGSDSTISGSGFTTLTATGGGAGIARNTFLSGQQNGGSGGGGGNTVSAGGTGIAGQGFPGGNGSGLLSSNDEHGGGGGGAGAKGSNATDLIAGAGGAGTNAYANWAIATSTGSSQCYGGGGGGGTNQSTQGAGGIGGGGQGANNQSSGTYESAAGVANSGGGSGGGAAGNAPNSPKNGGSGVVIIRYLGV